LQTNEQALRELIREQIELIEIAMLQNTQGEWSPDVLVPEVDEVSEASKKTKSKKYGGEKYSASAGSVAAIKKHKGSTKKAVASGAFDWASNPYAAAQAAHIVAMGEPTVAKGSKKKE
jgi:hypothetical protein